MLPIGRSTFQPNEYVQRWLLRGHAIGNTSDGRLFDDIQFKDRNDQLLAGESTAASQKYGFHTSGSTKHLLQSVLKGEDEARTTPVLDVLQKPSRHAAEPDRKKHKQGCYGRTRPVNGHDYGQPRGRQLDHDVASSDLRDLDMLRRPSPTSIKFRSLDEQIINTVSEISPTKKYAKRPRHKTKEDRYVFKGDQNGRKVKNGKSGLALVKNRTGRKRTGTMLKDDFEAPNVDSERLTLRRSSGPGFLGKSKSSALVAHRDIPDLTFPEMTYLTKRRRKEEAQFEQARTDAPKKQSKQDTSHTISGYSSQANPHTTNGQVTRRPSKNTQSQDLGIPNSARLPSGTRRTGSGLRSTSGISKKKQAGGWRSHHATHEVAQSYPSASQKEASSQATTQTSARSWSVSPPCQQNLAACVCPSPAAENVLQQGYKEKEQTVGCINHKRHPHEEVANLPSDESMYQYTRNALMGNQPGVWRHVPIQAEHQEEVSLDDLKRLAQGIHECDSSGANACENAGHARVEQPNIVSSSHGTYMPHVETHMHQMMEDQVIPFRSLSPVRVTGDISPHIRSYGNHDLNLRLEDASTLQTRPLAIHHKSRQDNDYDNRDTRAWPARSLIDRRSIPCFPPLEPTESAILPWRHTNCDNHDDGLPSRLQKHINNQSFSGIHTFPRCPSQYNNTDKLKNTIIQSHELFYRDSTDIIPSPETLMSSAGGVDVPESHSPHLDQFDLELLGASSSLGLHRNLSREGRVLPSNCSATNDFDATLQMPMDEPDHSIDPAIDSQQDYPHSGSRSWARLRRQAISPKLQPFTMFNRPYLLF